MANPKLFAWRRLCLCVGNGSNSNIDLFILAISVFANLLAVPIAAFVVMPSALLAILLMPFGLDGPALMLAGFGLDGIQAVASAAAAMPMSVIEVASWPRAVPPLFAAILILMVGLRGWWKGERYCSSDLHGHNHYYPSPRRFDRNA